MDVRPIKTDDDHAKAMRRIEKLWGARKDSPAADTLDVLITLVNAYEAEHHPIDPPDPIDAIRFRMEQRGLTNADLIPIIGTRARVSEILNKRRPLTISMIARLKESLGISADSLIRAAPRRARAAATKKTRARAPRR